MKICGTSKYSRTSEQSERPQKVRKLQLQRGKCGGQFERARATPFEADAAGWDREKSRVSTYGYDFLVSDAQNFLYELELVYLVFDARLKLVLVALPMLYHKVIQILPQIEQVARIIAVEQHKGK